MLQKLVAGASPQPGLVKETPWQASLSSMGSLMHLSALFLQGERRKTDEVQLLYDCTRKGLV